MRITTLFTRTPAAAPCCADGLAHCHETLVLHADGTVACDGEATCGLDELQHELWVACDELGCGCAGDDAPLDGWVPLLAA
jgi:hypothetical protein